MNAMFGFPPNRNNVRIAYRPLFIELVPCSGERLAIGVIADDGERWHVEPANRWGEVAVALGKTTNLLSDVAAEVIRFYKEELRSRKDISELMPPFSTVFVGEPRVTAGHTISDAIQNALRLATVFHIPLDVRSDIRAMKSAAPDFSLTPFREKRGGRLLRLVQNETVRRDPKLRSYFGRALSNGDKRIQPSVGFLSPFAAADFISIRPNQVKSSTRNARSFMQMLMIARKQPELKKGAPQIIYMQRPSASDPLWGESDIRLVEEACGELSKEANQLDIIPKVQEEVSDIVEDILSYATA